MTTPSDLITLALKQGGIIGRGQTARGEMVQDAFSLLNLMLGSWSKRRWLVYHLLDVSAVSTGALSYGVGPGASFNVARPDRIESAFARMLYGGAQYGNPVDWPLTVLDSREDYNRISLKGLNTFPAAVYYDAGWPFGTLDVWPIPTAGQWEIHIAVKAALPSFVTIFDDLDLPPEYGEAILYNLAARLRSAYQMPPDPVVNGLAQAALNTIRNANTQLAELQMPGAVLGRGWASGGVGFFGGLGAVAYAPGGPLSPPSPGGLPTPTLTPTPTPTGGAGALTDSAGGAITDSSGQTITDGSGA